MRALGLRLATAFALCCALFAVAEPAWAATIPPPGSYVDKRVNSLPASLLLSADPHALIDARRQAIAETLTIYRRTLFMAWALSQIAAFYYLWRSGAAARLRDALRRRIANPVALRFAYATVLGLIAAGAAAPASLAEYRVNLVFDQTTEPIAAWVRDGLLRVALDALALGLVVALVLTLVARTRQWWIYSIAGLFAASLLAGFVEPVIVAPLFNRYAPLPATSTLAAPLHELAQKAGVPNAPFYTGDVSRQTQLAWARISGYGPTARIVLGDTLLETATQGEVLFSAARQLDLYRHGDTFRSAFVFTLLFLASIAIGVILADQSGFRGDDDPLSRLALVGAIAGLVGLLAYPLYNGYSRHIERKADAFAVALTNDPASAARTFVRAADRGFVPICLSRPAEIYFSPVPSLGTRIAAATGHRSPCR